MTEEMFLVTAIDNWPGELGDDGFALEAIPASQLAELPLVLASTTHGARKLQEKFARTMNVRLNVIAEIDSLPQLAEMAIRASAYTLMSHSAVIKQVEEGSLAMVPIKQPAITRTAYLARSHSRPATTARNIVESLIVDIIGEMVDRYKLRATMPYREKKAEAAQS